MAILPIQDRAGDTLAMEMAFRVLQDELSQRGDIVDPKTIRDIVRRIRMRSPDAADPESLRELGNLLGAKWIVSTTIHEALRGEVPRISISCRIISTESADPYWSGFAGGSGLDSRGLFELGVVFQLEELVEIVTKRLFEDLPLDPTTAKVVPERTDREAAHLGTVAIVPFAGLGSTRATVNAEAVTEATRTMARDLGFRLLSSNQATGVLRRELRTWGEVDAKSREILHRSFGVEAILTGAVEAYEAGAGFEPRPRVMIGMRLVEARTGRVLWADGLEREGWYRQRLFRRGRIYSGGQLSSRVTKQLLQLLLDTTTSKKSK